MKRILKIMFVVGLFVALATSANALTSGTIPSNGTNNFIPALFAGPTIGGYYGAQLYLVGGPATIKIDYYGAEAGYNNAFVFNGNQLFNHTGGNTSDISFNAATPQASTSINNVNAGLLNFNFSYHLPGGGSVVNGYNPDNSIFNLPNFFVTFDPSSSDPGGPTSGQSVWLFLDDGNTVDDNHDDFLVKLSITCGNFNFSVPEPATMLLLGLGLIGLAGLRRK